MKILKPIRILKYVLKSEKSLKRIRKAFEEKDYQDCISECNDLLDYNAKDFFGHYYRGLSFSELKLFDEAIESFEHARESINHNKAKRFLNEYSCDIILRESIVYLKMREFDKAKELLDENIKRNPHCVSSFTKLARIEEDEGNYMRAIEIINKGIENNSSNSFLQDEKMRLTYNYTANKRYGEYT